MKALILAAGMGWRLGGNSGHAPKCLLRFADKSLLQRHLEILEFLGVSRIVVGVGYQADRIRRELDDIGGEMNVETVFNPDFDQGNIVTLWRMREQLETGEDVLLMDADVLYDFRLMQRLMSSKHADCFLMDRNFEPGDEPVKLRLLNGEIVEFGKSPDESAAWDVQGESIGFFKLSAALASRLSGMTQAFVDDGRLNALYEEALREIVMHDAGRGIGVEDVTGLPWIEIDFPEDVERAEREVLPALKDALSV